MQLYSRADVTNVGKSARPRSHHGIAVILAATMTLLLTAVGGSAQASPSAKADTEAAFSTDPILFDANGFFHLNSGQGDYVGYKPDTYRDTVRSSFAALAAAGFPATLIEKAGNHYDPDNGQSGTNYDLIHTLLPFLQLGWASP